MKYYLLIYYAAAKYPDLWDSVAVSADFYPNEYLGDSVGNNGQSTPIWGKVVPYVICKSATPTQEMSDAVYAEEEIWNLANPDNTTGRAEAEAYNAQVYADYDKKLVDGLDMDLPENKMGDLIPVMKLIFDQAEGAEIAAQLLARQTELVSNGVS